jgi:exodeoxyribonuclease VII large subunit
MTAAIRVLLHRESARFELAVGKIDALSPLAILKRGFALCRDDKGAIVKRSKDIARGDKVRVTLGAGELDCRVEHKTE